MYDYEHQSQNPVRPSLKKWHYSFLGQGWAADANQTTL